MRLYLIDGSSYVHRAFHAIRGLRTSKGLATNALWGFATMLRKFIREIKPELCAVVLDAGRETFRNAIYPEYKANRPEAPADLAMQFPYVRKVAEAMGFTVIEMEGFEADDVMATLVEKARTLGLEVSIESGDKDLLQLVTEGVVVHDPMREKTYDIQGVREKLGVPPVSVTDYLAIVGDSSDNVPGIAGIGEKGAAELVAAYGSLEGIYSHLDELPPRKREALLKGREMAFLSRRLVELRRDVPLNVDVMSLRLREPDRAMVTALFTELEFRSLLMEMEQPSREPLLKVGMEAPEALELTKDSLAKAFETIEHSPEIAIVAVFGRRDPVKPDCKGVAVATGPDKAVVIRPEHFHLLQKLATMLTDRLWTAAGYKELHQLFFYVGAELPLPSLDPVLANYVLNPNRRTHSLDALALEVLSEQLPPITDSSSNVLAKRACVALRLREHMEKALREAQLKDLVSKIELPLARVLAEMERVGVRVDREVLADVSSEITLELERLEKAIKDAAGVDFNLNSPKQLADVLFGKLMLPVVKKTKTGPSTDVTVLEELSDRHVVPGLILEYRALAKLRSTYVEALPELIHPITGRVHTSYNQMVTSTGRLSSSDPNLQNIPVRTETGRKIRRAFVAAEGYELVSADYSQIELRVLAHMSKDPQLAEAFRSGADIHRRTAARIFHVEEDDVTPEQRRAAKVVNFGLLYGMGPYRLSRDLKISVHEAQSIIDEYFSAFPAVRTYLDWILETARNTGRVPMLSGRHRLIEGINSRDRNERAAAERMALNAPIQGTAADVIKAAMVNLRERLRAEGLDARLVMQVHDELILEAREGQGDRVAAVLKEVMENAYELSVPLVVEVSRGRSWADL